MILRHRVINPMAEIYKHLAISILFMFIGFFIGKEFLPVSFVYLANKILMFFMLFLLLTAIFSRKSIIPRSFSMNFVYVFTFIDGILMYPILSYYLQSLGTDIVINVLIGAIVLFALLAFISHKKDAGHFLSLGPTLFASSLALLVVCIVNIFIGSSITNLIISIVGLVIFSVYVLYDISLIKYDISMGNIVDKNDLSIHVLNLYVDFINILLDLLNIVDRFND